MRLRQSATASRHWFGLAIIGQSVSPAPALPLIEPPSVHICASQGIQMITTWVRTRVECLLRTWGSMGDEAPEI